MAPPSSLQSPEFYLNRSLSWLAFNRRVLEEAEDESNPLLERVKFLAITASNLDEFFEIRIAGLLQHLEEGAGGTGARRADSAGRARAGGRGDAQIRTRAVRVLEREAVASIGRTKHPGTFAGRPGRCAARGGGRLLPQRIGRAADAGDGRSGASVSAGDSQGALPGSAAAATAAFGGNCNQLHGRGDGAALAAAAGEVAGCAGRFVHRACGPGGVARGADVSRL